MTLGIHSELWEVTRGNTYEGTLGHDVLGSWLRPRKHHKRIVRDIQLSRITLELSVRRQGAFTCLCLRRRIGPESTAQLVDKTSIGRRLP